ncbi:hypothetical protein [Amycolatopsis echigonensis]|uniref:Uncharacterized protein n=1 Tax=Amycolatopsis echigonensis TaxID=2576905 RepID=A0A8E2B9P5_9PSEU|nr:hypothetical protein [Amycolatopsis echigonensis]MBB2506356.1 hypothetical protein [Amycolatopsis echigonensis]
MDVTIEHVASTTDELADRIAETSHIISQRVIDPDQVELVVTGDFVASVRARATNAVEANHYSPERGSGVAIAKTIVDGDRSIIVVPGFVLSGVENVFDELGRHCISHEALHALLKQRGEDTSAASARLATTQSERDYLTSAGVIAEEYRVEACLAVEGSTPPTTSQSGFDDALEAARLTFLDAIILRHPAESMHRPSATARQGTHHLGIQLGYLAAELTNAHGTVPAIPPTALARNPLWARLVGPSWQRIAGVLSELPDASNPTAEDALTQTVLSLANALKDWIRHVGFVWRDTPEGGLYFDVLRHDFD